MAQLSAPELNSTLSISSDIPESLSEKVCHSLGVEAREWQLNTTQQVLDGHDVIIRAGTGSGKSLCYQAIVVAREQATVLVICPLLALIDNQVFLHWSIAYRFLLVPGDD
jgi:ATP-dependent helicase YprA (DUF1998 family)